MAEAAIARCGRTPTRTSRCAAASPSPRCSPTTRPSDGVPHVVGVRTDAGEELRADLVVDAAGRRSSLPKLLTAIGARAPIEEKEDCGFVYYGRHFRSADGEMPPRCSGRC